MDAALLAARLALAIILAIAGLTKLANPSGTRQAVVDFGVAPGIARPLARLLPISELLVAALLIPLATAWWGALGAAALFILFCVAIGVNLARGRTPNCHCFGQLHSEPIGRDTLARNGVLLAITGLILWRGFDDPGTSAIAWIGELAGIEVVGLMLGTLAVTVLGVEAWLILQLMQQNGRLLTRLEHLEALLMPGAEPDAADNGRRTGLSIGSLAPTFSLASTAGQIVTLEELRSGGRPVLLVFSDPGCGPCQELMPEVRGWETTHHAGLAVAVISRGSLAANRATATRHGITTLLLQQGSEVSQQFHANGTPSALVVNPDGSVGSALAEGVEGVRRLVANVARRSPMIPIQPVRAPNPRIAGTGNGAAQPRGARASRIGDDAPPLTLPNLNGSALDLGSFIGQSTLLLFWNPGCGYCQRMLTELREWEANPPPNAPALLVVSTGSVETNRALELTSPVVLDQGFNAGRAFGATGTPSAVLIDARGKIASEVAKGAQAVLTLARCGLAQPIR